ncbi:MAG: hypothetical protein ACOCYP_04505 [Planctomycetota bacterium]
MADGPQMPQQDLSSYSDPVYDRLEQVAHGLGRTWWLYVVAAVLAVVIALAMRSFFDLSPSAEAYRLLRNATDEGDDALAAFVDNAELPAEYRVHAALQAAQTELMAGRTAAAGELLEQAAALAGQSEHRTQVLELTTGLSRAAMLEDAGQSEEAMGIYEDVELRAGRDNPIQAILAGVGAVRCREAQAQAKAEAAGASADVDEREAAIAEARSLRERSIEQLRDLRDQPSPILTRYVRYNLLRLERQAPLSPIAPETPADEDGGAEAEAEEAATDTEPAEDQPADAASETDAQPTADDADDADDGA